MTTPNDPPAPTLAAAAAMGSWPTQWAQVPDSWRCPVYEIYSAPFDQVFLRNQFYLRANRAGAAHDFTPEAPARFAHEIAWWIWICWNQQLRKIEPSLLAWLVRTLPTAIEEHSTRTGRAPASIAELDPTTLVRQSVLTFQRRNLRLPSAGSRRNIRHLIEHLHLWISVRCTDTPWWEDDIWDLRADPRIPRRDHEPRHDATVRLRDTEPVWLREGLRFWLRSALTYELLVWSSAADRAHNLGSQLGRYTREHGYLEDPLITTDPDALRTVFLDYLEYLRSPAAATQSEHLTPDTVSTLQAQTQAFYSFMHDNAADAADATANRRWRDITLTHTALWSPLHAPKHRRRERELTWYATADLQRMLAYLDVLAAPTGHKVVLTRHDGTITIAAGLGDPQAARIWLLQALTGRRASEILMLDHDPLQAIPGQDRPPSTDPDAFVARLRYQQTKVDNVIPTILVEQAIVDIITEQQTWLKTKYPELQPRYLFLGVKNQHLGQQPRSYTTYRSVLATLDSCHDLTDSAGRPLRFTQTHRLRHTRATELLNDGVPFHVVQRYLGHKSPEMTARYANPRELHQMGALPQVTWPVGKGNDPTRSGRHAA
jgi:integrase